MTPLNKLSKSCLSVAVFNALASTLGQAATITVGNTGDGPVFGPCTLRDAITTHNTSTNTGNCVAVGAFGVNEIEFDLPNSSTISLVAGPLEITSNDLYLRGPGKDDLTIDASNVTNAITINGVSGVFIDGLTIDGGAMVVINSNNVELSDSTISNNTTTGYGGGIFIDTSSDVVVSTSQISNNTAYAGGGIAILSSSGTLIESSTITGNSTTNTVYSGGGILFSAIDADVSNRTLSIANSTISHNVTTGRGGGIATRSFFGNGFGRVSLDVEKSNISNNTARTGGGVAIGSGSNSNNFTDTVFATNTVTQNGGGVYSRLAAPAYFNRCTLSNNIARFGGGFAGDAITMTNSTISKNTATLRGSAIAHVSNYLANSIITQSTIVDNDGSAALWWGGASAATFNFEANNVVSNNVFGNCSADSTQPILFGTFNWLDDDTCGTINSGDPGLGELADNGGFTETHAPIPGSGLIGAGLLNACNSTPVDGVDQRDEPRGTSSCFIGSVEGVVMPPDPTSFFVIPLPNGKSVIFSF